MQGTGEILVNSFFFFVASDQFWVFFLSSLQQAGVSLICLYCPLISPVISRAEDAFSLETFPVENHVSFSTPGLKEQRSEPDAPHVRGAQHCPVLKCFNTALEVTCRGSVLITSDPLLPSYAVAA